MDSLRYDTYQRQEMEKFEAICKNCGQCCGSQDGDSCTNMVTDETGGKYYCRIYENRLGPQKTVSGKTFHCIPIRDIIKWGTLRSNCAYRSMKE